MKTVILSAALAAAAALSAPCEAQQANPRPLRIGHPWTRPTPPGAAAAVGYLRIDNDGPVADRLLGGSSPLVDRIEVHQVTLIGGVMRMRPVVGGLTIPAHGTATLAPGGFHLMLIGPKRQFKVGDRIPAMLRFERAGPVRIRFTAEFAPMSGVAASGAAR